MFNLTFIQSIVCLCREFDDEERQTWMRSLNQDSPWSSYKSYITYVANYIEKNGNLFALCKTNKQFNENNSAFFMVGFVKFIFLIFNLKFRILISILFDHFILFYFLRKPYGRPKQLKTI
jgi:hypothetical protein